ncbi:MAG: hypothetical protein K8I00_03135, partial [Candidatus Omnitrophica bacterium]|nr:hypothetical protein [Candidatus Omnitrophota bacterium]
REAWQQFRQERATSPAYAEVFRLVKAVEGPQRPEVTPRRPWIRDVYTLNYFNHVETNPYRDLVNEPYITWPPLKTFEILGNPIVERDILMIGAVIDVPMRMPVFERPEEPRDIFAVIANTANYVENRLDLLVDYMLALFASIWDRIVDIINNKKAMDHRQKTMDAAEHEVENVYYDLPIEALLKPFTPDENIVEFEAEEGLNEYAVTLPKPMITTAPRVLTPAKSEKIDVSTDAKDGEKTAVFYAMTYTGDSAAGLTDVALLARELDLTKGLPENYESTDDRVAAWREFYDKKVKAGDAEYIRQISERFRRDTRPAWQQFKWDRENHPDYKTVFALMEDGRDPQSGGAVQDTRVTYVAPLKEATAKPLVLTQTFKDKAEVEYTTEDAQKIMDAALNVEEQKLSMVTETENSQKERRHKVKDLPLRDRLKKARAVEARFRDYKRRRPYTRNKLPSFTRFRGAQPKVVMKNENWKTVSNRFAVIHIDDTIQPQRRQARPARQTTVKTEKSTYKKPVYTSRQRERVIDATLAMEEQHVSVVRPQFNRRPRTVIKNGRVISDTRGSGRGSRYVRYQRTNVTRADRDRVMEATLYLEDVRLAKTTGRPRTYDPRTVRERIRQQSMNQTLRSEEDKMSATGGVTQQSRAGAAGDQDRRDAAVLAQPATNKKLVIKQRDLNSSESEMARARHSAKLIEDIRLARNRTQQGDVRQQKGKEEGLRERGPPKTYRRPPPDMREQTMDAALLTEELRIAGQIPSFYERMAAQGIALRPVEQKPVVIREPTGQNAVSEQVRGASDEMDAALLLEEIKMGQA